MLPLTKYVISRHQLKDAATLKRPIRATRTVVYLATDVEAAFKPLLEDYIGVLDVMTTRFHVVDQRATLNALAAKREAESLLDRLKGTP